MKKAMILLILLVFPIIIMSLPTALEAGDPLKVGIFIPLTGPAAPFALEITASIEQVRPKISKDLKLFFYDKGSTPITSLADFFAREKIKVIIVPFWDETATTSALQTMQGRGIMTVLPIFSGSLMKFAKEYSDVYVIPEPSDQIILAIDRSIRRAGSANVNALKKTLMDETKKAQEKAAAYQMEISSEVTNTVGRWEQERGIAVRPSENEFLRMNYSSKFISYMIVSSARERRLPQLIKAVSKDTYNILDATPRHGYRSIEGTTQLESFKTSGVLECNALPCKSCCCDYYKVENLCNCRETMKCR